MPLVSRNALYAVALLPGVATTGGPRGAIINGLPNNTVNVTIDGVNTGNMLQSTDGFFSMVTPRMDAVEEITVTGAVPGSGGGAGLGAGRHDHPLGLEQLRRQRLSLLARSEVQLELLLQQGQRPAEERGDRAPVGFRQGGPIVLPGLYDGRGKAFFFFNFEQLYQPSSATRTRAFLTRTAAERHLRLERDGRRTGKCAARST